MADILTFDTAAIADLTATLTDAVAGIGDHLTDLEREAANGAWTGQARASYIHAQHQWTAALTELQDVLDQASKLTDGTRHVFNDAERAVKEMWR